MKAAIFTGDAQSILFLCNVFISYITGVIEVNLSYDF